MGDYKTAKDILLDESLVSTPDMGEYLDNDDITKLASSIAEGSDGGAYFLEAPFSTELGYHEAESAFVISAKPSVVVDGDTYNFKYDSVQDGSKPFVFLGDGKEYGSVKDYMWQIFNLNKQSDSLSMRCLGINAPEVPHLSYMYANKNYTRAYAKFSDLTSDSMNVQLYTKDKNNNNSNYKIVAKTECSFLYCNIDWGKNNSGNNNNNGDNLTGLDAFYKEPRKEDYEVNFIIANAHTEAKGEMEVYYEIVEDVGITDDDKNNLSVNPDEITKLVVCFIHDPSAGRELDQYYHESGTESRDDIKKLISQPGAELIWVLDGTTFKQQKDTLPDEYKSDVIRLSQDPGFAFQYICNQVTGNTRAYTRLGYNYFGQDYNKRCIGVLYLKINYTDDDGKNYGNVWLNASKYLAFKWNQWAAKKNVGKVYQILPAYSSSPSIESNLNYNSAAFKMWTYNPDAQCYIDSFNDFHGKYGGDDRATVQEAIVGSSLDTLRDYTVLIGDCLLMVPPTSIRMVSQTNSQRTSLLRSKGAITKTIPKVERIIEMQLYFNGEQGINGIQYEQTTPSGDTMIYHMNGLRALVAQFKFCPYLPINNKYINEVLNIEAVGLSSIQINTVPGFPRTLQATIRLNDFEYRQFMPEILPPNVDKKEDFAENLFAKTIHFPVMRYYYQRAIQNGEAANSLEYNSTEYLDATLGQKTVLQPMKFAGPLIDFYVANEEFLKMRKQLKEALEKKPFETVVTYTDAEKKFLKEVAKMYSVISKLMNSDDTKKIITKINSESGLVYYPNNRSVLDIPFSELSKTTTGLYSDKKNNKEIYSTYLADIIPAFNKFFESKDSFDSTIISDHNIVLREIQVNGSNDVKVTLALKLVIDWNKGSANLENKLKQDYGKQFAIKTDMMLINDAFTIGYTAEFINSSTTTSGNIKCLLSSPFSTPNPQLRAQQIDMSNADVSLLSKLANDFSDSADTNTNGLIGNDLFEQNQELAKMKDNIDLETDTSMKFDKFPIYNCLVNNISVIYNNNFTKMSLNSMHGYASQYIGASDTVIEVEMQTKDETIVNLLQTLPRQCAELLINYRKIMTCSPIRIDCELARFAGINEVIIESIDINTVPNYPGLYTVSLRLVSVDRTLRNREALKKVDGLDTSITNNDNYTMTQNFFELDNRLKKVELYPDLELPLISDLEKLGYYFIRYKNQIGRLFPDADFYFVYLHAYTSEMLKESIVTFFNQSDFSQLQHEIVDDLTGTSKTVALNLSLTDKDGNIKKPEKLIEEIKEEGQTDEYDDKIKKLYEEAENAFASSLKYVTVANKDKATTIETDIVNKEKGLLSLQESVEASNYATYDFNHQIKISTKDNVAFKEAMKDINSGTIKIVTEDGTHTYEDADDIFTEVNSSLKHMIKNVLKNPIADEKGIFEIVEYIAKDVLQCEGMAYSVAVVNNSVTVLKKDTSVTSNASKTSAYTGQSSYTKDVSKIQNQATGNKVTSGTTTTAASTSANIANDLYDFIRNRLRIALSSAATGKNSVLDFEKSDQAKNIDKWIGSSTVTYTDKSGNDTTVPNVLKTLDGQDTTYVIPDPDDADDIYKGIIFGPFGIKKYDSKYLGAVYGSQNFAGKTGFIDPYYNKDAWNILFADEIKAGTMDAMTQKDEDDRIKSYIDKISDKSWDNKQSVDTMSDSTVAMYRILLVWFYRLLNDENCSMLPNSFFTLMNVSNVLNDVNNTKSAGMDYLANGWDPRTWIANATNGLGNLISSASDSIFGTNTKAAAELNSELLAKEKQDSADLQKMKADLKNGLIVTKINLVAGLFMTLGALSVGEFNTPILPAVTGGNLADFTNYVETIKAAYLNYDNLNQVDVKMRRFFSYLDIDEYNNETSWNKKVDPLKKYSIESFIQRKYLAMADIPQIYLLHSFYDMVAHDMRGRMARAFPTYYMLLIDEGRNLGMWHLQDNFYDTSSISEFQIVKSRKIAADTANITMTNLFGTFTSEDEDMKDEYQYTFRDAWNSIFSPRPYYEKEYTRRAQARDFNRAKIKPGARVHLRLGYEGDASRIPIMFNGVVAEVDTVDDMISIICQGDGVELANPDMFNAADVDDVAELKYTDSMLGGVYGMFNKETTPRDILVNPLISSGTWIRSLIKDWSNSRFFNDNPFGIVHFGDKYYHEVFTNSGEMEQNIYEALNKPSWGSAGEGNFNESLWAMETPPKIQVGLEGKKSYWDLMNIAASVSPEYISTIVPFQMRSSIFYGAPRYYCAYDYERTAEGKVVEKRKPLQQYHVYTSYSDIIGNKIAASDKDIRTCAVGVYQGSGWLTTTSKSIDPMWLDIDIYPEKQKMTVINCDFTHREFSLPFTIPVISKATEQFTEQEYKVAWRATANGLKETVKDMYTGELIVIGDPAVKPYDKMFVYDVYQDIQGTFDVEAVVQTFSVETGFTTSISPDCVVAVDDKYEKIAHNALKTVIAPALAHSLALVMLSQRFANVTRSMFFAAGQAIKSGSDFTQNVANGVKTVMGSDDVNLYGGMADKVLGDIAPIFGATASDFAVYSAISSLEKAFKSIPASHNLTSKTDLLKMLLDIKAQPSAIAKLDPTELKKLLEEALTDTSKLNNLSSDMAAMAKTIIGNKTPTSTKKIEEAIKNLDQYISAYSSGTKSASSMTVSKDFIDQIIAKVPKDKTADVEEAINSLKGLDSGIVAGDKKFTEEMTNLLKVANVSKIDNLTEEAELLAAATKLDKEIFGVTSEALASFSEIGTTLKDVNTVVKGTGAIKAVLSTNLIWLAAQIVITKCAQEYLERKLKNLQVLTVFPVMKNNLVMTAGLDGNMGSVFDSPTYNQPGFIEQMAANFFDGKYGTVYPILLSCLVDTTNMQEIVNNYKRDSAYQNGSLEVLQDAYTKSLLTATALQDVNGIEAYRQMYMVPRCASATDTDGRTAFAKYKLVDIEHPDTNAIIDNELNYIFGSDYLKKLNSQDKPERSVLIFAAQANATGTDSNGNSYDTPNLTIKASKGGQGQDITFKCKKIEQGGDNYPIYDIPMLRKDARATLEVVVKTIVDNLQPDATTDNSTLEKLHKHNIIIQNATRVNDKKSWFCTGFSFTIQVKGWDDFGNILEKLHKDQPKISLGDGTFVNGWNYKQDTTMGDNTYMIMVMPPK